jgi:hypothetical protein
LAGFAGAFIDREVETRGVSHLAWFSRIVHDLTASRDQMDAFDSEKAKYEARRQAEDQLGQNQQW